MSSAPFAVGGDPLVDPTDFRVTTFASGLNYPHGMTTLSDGSLLVGVSNPVAGDSSYFNTTGQLLRFTDANGDGVADGAGTSLFDGLAGEVTAVHQAGPYILATSSLAGSERITILHVGATPSAPLTLAGRLNFSFPGNWEHTTFASAVRPTPGQPGDFDVFFNIGSEFNGVVIGSDGNVVLDSSGNPTYQPTLHTVTASGLINGTLNGDSIYKVTLHDNAGTPVLSNLTQIATGLRNAASLVFDPNTGDLYIADNGIDGNDGGNEAWSTDELDRIPAAQIGGTIENFGFPFSYTKTIDKPGDPVTVVNPGPGVVQPLIAYEPLPDSVLTAEGSESEGSSGIALSPTLFPDGLNQGVFVGFHGIFNSGGIANDENPFVFADPSTGHYFDFISNNEPNIGHLDEALSTADSLFIADIASTGSVFGSDGPGTGVIYQVKAIHPPLIATIGATSVEQGKLLTIQITATDQDTTQTEHFSLGSGSPSGAAIDPATGVFTWQPGTSTPLGMHSITVNVTDNGVPPLSDSQTFTVNVVAPLTVNHPPIIATIPTQSILSGQTLLLSIGGFVSDPDTPAQTLRYSLGPGAPDGVSLDPNSGRLSWTPSTTQAPGTYPIVIRVTDNGLPAMSAETTLLVDIAGAQVVSPQTVEPPIVYLGPAAVIDSLTAQRVLRGLGITLNFSQPLVASTANDPNNYQLRLRGRDGKFGTADDVLIPLTAAYNPSDNSVLLTTHLRFRFFLRINRLQLTVLGTSPGNVTGENGNLLIDGDRNGQPGGNDVRLISRRDFLPIRDRSLAHLSVRENQAAVSPERAAFVVPSGPLALFKPRRLGL